ncbi:MAG: hypothetical protein ACK52V_10470 [Betaproteobacteria bacterium]|jgi:hypothetical protein|nr:hypothetical protein [Betaproteobacteria bacterium]
MYALRRIFSLLLLISLPLQGLAAFAPTTPCAEGHVPAYAGAVHAHAPDSGGHHMHTTPDPQGPGQEGGAGTGHTCCHHVYTGTPPLAAPATPEAPGVLLPRVSLLATLFIPDLPQRPPRA